MRRQPATRLALNLLGVFRAHREAGSPLHLPVRKVQALLAYLALPPGRPHSREKLTTLLWGDTSPPQARASFRQALATLKRALASEAAPALVVDDDTLALDPACVDVDVQAFERLLAATTPEALERAMALYEGDLLEGFTLDEAAFDDWLRGERERLRELALQGLARLLAHQTSANLVEPALRTAIRSLALDPLQEIVHRALMRLYMSQGRRSAALRQYQACVTALDREMGITPEAETKQLYWQIVRQRAGPAGPGTPAEAGWSPGAQVRETALVGRDVPLARLRAVFEDACNRRGGVVVVRGEAGIGKSRMVADLALEAVGRGTQILFGRCRESEQILPFRPWIEAVRSGRVQADADLLARVGPGARRQLSRLFPELGTGESHLPAAAEGPTALFEALAELIAAAAARQPVVIVLEDLHWADELSLRLVSFVGRRLAAHRALLVGTIRDEDSADVRWLDRVLGELAAEHALEQVALAPLTAAETTSLVEALAATTRTPAWVALVADRVWALSEGNPLVIVETLHGIRRGRDPAAGNDLVLPDTVRRSIAERLDRLSEVARRLAEVAAVIGREFSFELLQRAAGLGERETAGGLEELVRRRLLEAVGNRFDFTHDRLRRVTLDRLLPAARVLDHRAVAEALEHLHADDRAAVEDRLAYHWEEGGVADRAIAYLSSCAETARHRFALDEAIRLLDRALGHVERVRSTEREPTRVDLVVRKAYALSLAGRLVEARDLLLSHGPHVERLGRDDVAGPYWVRLGMVHSYLGAHADADAAAQRALAVAGRCGDELSRGLAYHVLAATAYWTAVPRDGVEHARRAVQSLTGRPRTEEWLALAHYLLGAHLQMLGRFEPALAAAAQVEALGQAIGNARVQGFALFARGLVMTSQGHYERALSDCRRAVEIARDPFTRATAQAMAGHAHLEKGEPDAARSLLAQAIEGFRVSGNRRMEQRWSVVLAEAELMCGEVGHAGKLAEQALATSEETRARWHTALARRLLGRIGLVTGALDEAGPHLHAARELFAAIGAGYEEARTRLALAEVDHARGDWARAVEHLRNAHAAFTASGVPAWAARAERLAGSLGLTAAGVARG